MSTLVGLQTDLHKLLKQLLELELDAIRAYDSAITRIGNDDYRAQLTAFRADHQRHVQQLARVLGESGREPPKGPDLKRVLTEGKVVVASLIGDRALLFAMRTNESDTKVAYERASASALVAPQVKELLRRNLADERRHHAWLDREVTGEEPPCPPPAGPAV